MVSPRDNPRDHVVKSAVNGQTVWPQGMVGRRESAAGRGRRGRRGGRGAGAEGRGAGGPGGGEAGVGPELLGGEQAVQEEGVVPETERQAETEGGGGERGRAS